MTTITESLIEFGPLSKEIQAKTSKSSNFQTFRMSVENKNGEKFSQTLKITKNL